MQERLKMLYSLNQRAIAPGILFLLIAVVAYTQNQAQQPVKMSITKIKGDLYEIEGGGGNVVVYVTGEGVIMVDDKNGGDRFYDAIMQQIKTVTDKPVKYVFNTHYHADHTGTNNRFAQGAQVISTLNSRLNTLGQAWRDAYGEHRVPPTTPGPPSVPAQIVFKQDITVFLGGKEVQAHYFGRGHTNGDAVIYFPAEKIIHTGDMVSRTGTTYGPMIDYDGGGSIVEITKTLTAMASNLDFDTVIPGHGPVIDKPGLMAYIKDLEAFRAHVTEVIHEHKTQDEVAKVLAVEQGWKPNNLNIQWTLPGLMRELK